MRSKSKWIALILALTILGCGTQNSNTSNEDVNVAIDNTIDSVQSGSLEISVKTSKDVITAIENKIKEISKYTIIRGIDFYEDYAYILTSDKENGTEILMYNMQTGESDSKELDIKMGDTENICIHNGSILVDNILGILDSGTVIVLDTSMNQIAEYNNISGVYTYADGAVYYYRLADNSMVEDRDGKKTTIRQFAEDTVDGNQIIDIDRIESINNEYIYAQVSYFANGADESSYGLLKIVMSDKNEDILEKKASNITSANNIFVVTDREESVLYGQQSTLTTEYRVISPNGKEQKRSFENSKEAELVLLSNGGNIMITDADMTGRIYDIETNEVKKIIDNEEDEWFIYAKICEKYNFIMKYEYNGEMAKGTDVTVRAIEY